MANDKISFYYDPQRQGYDTSTWKTLFGSPVVAGNSLQLSNASIVHYGDIVRGEITINLTIPNAPAAGDDRVFGLLQPSKNAYIYFQIDGTSFTARTSNGTDSSSASITWQDAWTNVSTAFTTRWEAGRAVFLVNGIVQATIVDVSVTGDALSIYAENVGATTMDVDYVNAKAIQNYWFNNDNQDASFQFSTLIPEGLSITESVTITNPPAELTGIVSSLSLAESVGMLMSSSSAPGEDLTIGEDVSVAVV